MSNIKLNLDIEKTLEVILSDIYQKEFVSDFGRNRHPQGINFYTWLRNKDLITEEEHFEIQKEIDNEN